MLVILPELLIESGGFRKEIPLCHCISEKLDDGPPPLLLIAALLGLVLTPSM